MLGLPKIQSRAGRAITAREATVFSEADPPTTAPLGGAADFTGEGLPGGHPTSQASNFPRYVCKSRFIVKHKFNSFGRSVAKFSSPVAKPNFRPLGTKCYPRVPPLLVDGTISESHTQYTCVRLSSQLNRRRSQRNDTKRGSSCSSQLSPPRRFCQFSLSSSQKGRRPTPSNQFQRAKSILKIPAFQSGGYSHVTGSCQRKRPPSRDRFERRILYHSNLEEPSKVSQIPLERYPPGIHVPPLWASFSTPGVHQDTKTSRSIVTQTRCTTDYLFGRHPDHGRVSRDSQSPCQPGSQLANQLGLCDQPQKVSSKSQSTVRVSGVHSQLSNYDSVLNPRQTSSNQERE